MTVGELADEYGKAGIGAADLHEAVDITAEMFDDDVTTFLVSPVRWCPPECARSSRTSSPTGTSTIS